jgi:hypothetical protein
MNRKQVHQKSCGKRESYERGSNVEMNKKLTEALRRLGEPEINYRDARDRVIKANQKSKR